MKQKSNLVKPSCQNCSRVECRQTQISIATKSGEIDIGKFLESSCCQDWIREVAARRKPITNTEAQADRIQRVREIHSFSSTIIKPADMKLMIEKQFVNQRIRDIAAIDNLILCHAISHKSLRISITQGSIYYRLQGPLSKYWAPVFSPPKNISRQIINDFTERSGNCKSFVFRVGDPLNYRNLVDVKSHQTSLGTTNCELFLGWDVGV